MGRSDVDDFEDEQSEDEEADHQASSPSPDDLFPILVPVPVPKKITPQTTKIDVLRQDAEIYHAAFQNLAACWSQATTVDEVCKLALTTDKMILGRRRALLLPHGAPPTEEPDDRYVLPLD